MPMPRVRRHEPISRAEFHELLQEWLDGGDEPTIGDPGSDEGRTAWIWIQDDGLTLRLHGETTREGVAAYLRLLAQHGPGLRWTMAPSRRNNPNRIAFGPGAETIPGFGLYLSVSQVGQFGFRGSGA